MAEQANLHLEGMLPELKDLEQRGIFTKLEIKSIVKKRTAFEYGIHRKIVKKADFLKYIEYEINLERLRSKRKLRLDQTSGKGKRGVTLSDYSIVCRIHQLHQKALGRFSGDIRLWLQYFEWCKRVGSSKALGKSFAKAIQLHPTKPIFWILAATWEFEENSDIASARVLMQRALRINPTNQKLWIEYFKLELLWVEKIKERRRILFKEDLDNMPIDTNSSVNDKDTKSETDDCIDICKDGNDESSQSKNVEVAKLEIEAELEPTLIEKDKAITESQNHDNNEMMKKELTPLQKTLLEVMVPRAIYRNAIKAFPKDLSFSLSFLEIYKQFGKGSVLGIEEIYQSLKVNFPEDPEALCIFAEHHVLFVQETDPLFPAALKKSISTYQTNLEAHPTSTLWSKYIAFMRSKRSICIIPELIRYLDILILRAYNACHTANCSTILLYLEWTRWVNDQDKTDIIDKALSAFPSSSLLWLEKINNLESIMEKKSAFEKAISLVSNAEKCALWQWYCQFTIECSSSPSEVQTAFETSLSASQLGGTKDEETFKELYLDWAITQPDGLELFRKIRTTFTNQKLQSIEFFQKCIGIETQQWMSQMADGNISEAEKTKHALETLWKGAVQVDRSRLDTWLGYIRFTFEICKDPKCAAQLYWMAGKEVDDKDELERQFQEMKL
ncbi:U3 snoRNP protein [Batrachochytrium dendrobatidis]|nr:U3 snoRNP protein [Batrachochytrium dendrobatidis]KAK5672075.1 U3 snoRNP protein [Batrachochytrium dendrobatidis]